MMDHRKTNFPMGNVFQNEFNSRAQRLNYKFNTIDPGNYSKTPVHYKTTIDLRKPPISQTLESKPFAQFNAAQA